MTKKKYFRVYPLFLTILLFSCSESVHFLGNIDSPNGSTPPGIDNPNLPPTNNPGDPTTNPPSPSPTPPDSPPSPTPTPVATPPDYPPTPTPPANGCDTDVIPNAPSDLSVTVNNNGTIKLRFKDNATNELIHEVHTYRYEGLRPPESPSDRRPHRRLDAFSGTNFLTPSTTTGMLEVDVHESLLPDYVQGWLFDVCVNASSWCGLKSPDTCFEILR